MYNSLAVDLLTVKAIYETICMPLICPPTVVLTCSVLLLLLWAVCKLQYLITYIHLPDKLECISKCLISLYYVILPYTVYFVWIIYRIQPNAETRNRQLQAWRSLVLEYHRASKQSILDVREAERSPLFNNTAINSILYIGGVKYS